jgi:hypothetical protein
MNGEIARTIVRQYVHRLLNEHDVSVCDRLALAQIASLASSSPAKCAVDDRQIAYRSERLYDT